MHNDQLLIRGRLPQESESFDEILYAQMKNAPWIGASVAFHGALIGLLLLMPTGDGALPHVAPSVIAHMPTEKVDLDDPVVPPKNIEPDPTKVDKRVEDDVLDLPPDIEASVDQEVDDVTAGDPDFSAIAPFDEAGQNAAIGIGVDAGGAWGKRGLGANKNGSGGGGKGYGTEPEVDRALSWLSNHQAPNGSWDCDGFADQCKLNQCSGPGNAVHDPGVTGLALLAFLAQGDTQSAGRYKDTVKSGLRYLVSIQDAEGCIGPRTGHGYQYSHAIATMALAEAYGVTGSRVLRGPAQRAVNFIHNSQNPYMAWRYGVRDGDNDTSVTGWMVMALKSAKLAELQVDEGSFRSALAWVDKMTEPEFGRVGYQRRGGPSARQADMIDQFPADQTESVTSVGVLTRVFCGQDPEKNELVAKGADLMQKKLPRWDIDAGTIDMYYWYYGTLAMHQIGGARWKEWNRAMKSAIADHQRLEQGRDEYGSWDPVGPWGVEGGRVYSTALMTLSLQVYYRYSRVF